MTCLYINYLSNVLFRYVSLQEFSNTVGFMRKNNYFFSVACKNSRHMICTCSKYMLGNILSFLRFIHSWNQKNIDFFNKINTIFYVSISMKKIRLPHAIVSASISVLACWNDLLICRIVHSFTKRYVYVLDIKAYFLSIPDKKQSKWPKTEQQ